MYHVKLAQKNNLLASGEALAVARPVNLGGGEFYFAVPYHDRGGARTYSLRAATPNSAGRCIVRRPPAQFGSLPVAHELEFPRAWVKDALVNGARMDGEYVFTPPGWYVTTRYGSSAYLRFALLSLPSGETAWAWRYAASAKWRHRPPRADTRVLRLDDGGLASVDCGPSVRGTPIAAGPSAVACTVIVNAPGESGLSLLDATGNPVVVVVCAAGPHLYKATNSRDWVRVRRYVAPRSVVNAATSQPDGRDLIISRGGHIRAMTVSPDGRLIAVAMVVGREEYATLRIYDATVASYSEDCPLVRHFDVRADHVSFSPDGCSVLAYAESPRAVTIVDLD